MLQKTRSLHLILFAILLAGCNSSNLASKVFKDKIQINGSEFEIHMFGYDSTESTGYFHPERIEIKENADADPIQTITDLNKYSELDAQGELIGFIDDYNFDGHPDFGFSIAEPMMGLDPYSLYLYNEKNKMFEFNDFLEMSPRVELNKERKELTFTAGRGDNYTKYTYKYKEGEFYVIKEVAEIYYYEDETRTVTTSELIGGEMKQTDFQKFMGMEGGNDIEIKKSGQMKGQKELANFLRMIDGQRETFDPVKLNGSEYLRWHDSCYNPGFSIIKYPVEDYEFDEFNLDVYPLLTWYVEGAEENYSIRSITYRNYGNDFNMEVVYVEIKYDDETNELGKEKYWYRWSYDDENGYWRVYEDLSGYGENGEKLYLSQSIMETLPMSEEECDNEMF